MTEPKPRPNRTPPLAAIAGNPNCGKTCLFNALTGSNLKVGNYPGVTVERREGRVRFNSAAMTVVDLPGTYSLTALSADEIVARNVLLREQPDVVLNVADASNLERNLYLTTQLMEMELPIAIALNMIDVAERRGVTVDTEKMSAMLGVPVVPTVCHRGRGVRDVARTCGEIALNGHPTTVRPVTYGHGVDEEVDALAARIRHEKPLASRFPPRWLAIKLIEKDAEIIERVAREADNPDGLRKAADKAIHAIESHFGEPSEVVIAESRYGFAAGVIRECVSRRESVGRSRTDRIDAVVCHRVLGPIILAAVVYSLFIVVFKVADEWPWMLGRSPTERVEQLFAGLADAVSGLQTISPTLHSLLADGIIGGVAGILVFVPLIFVMFACIAALEDTGYMARAAFVLDRLLRAFGLQGKSIMAMIVSGGLGGGGCAVPGVMATRVLRDRKDRLVTMLVAPMMNCGAKIPVYLMLIGAFFVHAKPLVMFILWALSWVFALLSALLIRRFIVTGEHDPFVMELPVYHMPTLRGVWRHTWNRTWMFIKKAGTLILCTSILLWAAMYFPRLDTQKYDKQIAALEQKPGPTPEAELNRLQRREQSAQLQYSLAGRAGTAIESVTRYAGFDWRDNIALIGGFAAKEVIVSTLGVAYSMGDVDPHNAESLSERLRNSPNWSPLKAFAMMIFVMLYAPCVTVQIVTRRESGSWKWPAFSIAYTVSLALLLAVAVYQGGQALGWGV